MKNPPISRHVALQPLSRDHHQGLLLSWKIRTGLKKQVPADRIKRYIDWFYNQHLAPHFEVEEKWIFPLLAGHELVKRAEDEHSRLRRLFESPGCPEECLHLIEKELKKHIRFEERVLFPEIEKVATAEQLAAIEQAHSQAPFCENAEDEFWSA